MTAPVARGARLTGVTGSDVAELRTEFNKLVLAVRGIAAKLDADGGVTGTDYVALWTDDQSATGGAAVVNSA